MTDLPCQMPRHQYPRIDKYVLNVDSVSLSFQVVSVRMRCWPLWQPAELAALQMSRCPSCSTRFLQWYPVIIKNILLLIKQDWLMTSSKTARGIEE